eukprot:3867543-Alexandrium_andersonii.AAC.1
MAAQKQHPQLRPRPRQELTGQARQEASCARRQPGRRSDYTASCTAFVGKAVHRGWGGGT